MYRFSLSCFSSIYINTHIPGLHLYPQAYLAFFVIDDLQMAQSAKALVSERSISVDHRTFFLIIVIINSSSKEAIGKYRDPV